MDCLTFIVSSRPSAMFLVILLLSTLCGCQNQVLAPILVKNTSAEKSAPIFRRGVHVKPNEYIVQRGDSVYGIAWRYGIDYRNIIRWNRIIDKDLIYEGQVLEMTEDEGYQSNIAPIKRRLSPKTSTAKTKYKREINWRWPASGKIRFVSENSKVSGVEVLGSEGSPITSAAKGSVVYSGNGLKGYGELIILKHNESFLSAYAHSKKRLVEEGDNVEPAEVIGLMGSTGSTSTMLYFEIRRNGKAVNPKLYLPSKRRTLLSGSQ